MQLALVGSATSEEEHEALQAMLQVLEVALRVQTLRSRRANPFMPRPA